MTSKPPSFLRRRKGSDSNDNEHRRDKEKSNKGGRDEKENKEKDKDKRDQNELKEEEGDDDLKRRRKRRYKNWSCVDSCCWFIGCICSIWWLLLFLFNAMPASIPQYVTEAITGPLPDPPGVKLRKEGLEAKHPVVFVPGIVTGGLELWEGHHCAEGLFRKRLWGGSFGEVYKRTSSTLLRWTHLFSNFMVLAGQLRFPVFSFLLIVSVLLFPVPFVSQDFIFENQVLSC